MMGLYYGFKKNLSGVTIVETILVVAILVIIFSSAFPIASSTLARRRLSDMVSQLTVSLKTAQIYSMTSREGLNWGVDVASGSFKIFAQGNSSFDEDTGIAPGISITTQVITYDKITGNPDAAKTFTLSNAFGDSYQISINQVGAVGVTKL